jgi:hypothetical protein
MLIGLAGRRRAGKDLVASFLKDTHGFEVRKFAGPMKAALCALFDWNGDHMEGNLKEVVDPRWGVSPRKMMQFFGTELMQFRMQELIPDMGRSYAVKRAFLESSVGAPCSDIVISDTRFQHEVDAIREHGGITIRINRPSLGSQLDTAIDSHASEADIDLLDVDFDVKNDSTVDALHTNIAAIIAQHKRSRQLTPCQG